MTSYRARTALTLLFLTPACFAQQDALQSQILTQERQGLEFLKTGHHDEFAATLAEGAVFVDSHGPAGAAQVVKNTAEFRLTDFSMEDVKFVPLSANSGLIVYKLTETGVSHGKDFSANVYVSAVWAERHGKWVCLFSQETAAR